MDATAGAAIGSRQGLGKVKHIHTAFLWVQNLVRDGRVTLSKVHTSENPADVLTKPVDQKLMCKVMQRLNFVSETGRNSLSLKV